MTTGVNTKAWTLSDQERTRLFSHLKKSSSANKRCFDCNRSNPSWASVHFAIYLCLECSAIHRRMGTHITFVRSTTLDTWTRTQAYRMMIGGNAVCEKYFTSKHQSLEGVGMYRTLVATQFKAHLDKLVKNSLQSLEAEFAQITADKTSKKQEHKIDEVLEENTGSGGLDRMLNEIAGFEVVPVKSTKPATTTTNTTAKTTTTTTDSQEKPDTPPKDTKSTTTSAPKKPSLPKDVSPEPPKRVVSPDFDDFFSDGFSTPKAKSNNNNNNNRTTTTTTTSTNSTLSRADPLSLLSMRRKGKRPPKPRRQAPVTDDFDDFFAAASVDNSAPPSTDSPTESGGNAHHPITSDGSAMSREEYEKFIINNTSQPILSTKEVLPDDWMEDLINN